MSDQYSVRLDIQYETIKGLKTALAEANKELENAKINTVEWTNAFKKVGELKGQMVGVTAAMRQTAVATQQTSQASANAGMALLNLNYVIRDSPYFFQNFALGVLAVGNNLNPLIDSFSRLRQEAGAKSLTTFALLRQALVGGAGLSIAFSVVVTAIQAFVFWQAKAGKESGETAKEVDLLTEALKRFVKVDMPSGKTMFSIDPSELQKVIDETQKQLDDVESTLSAIEMKKSYGSNSWNDNVKVATEEATKSKEELEKVKKILEEDLEIYKTELRARQLLGDLGVEESARQKEKTKELKKQKEIIEETRVIQFKSAQELFEFEQNKSRYRGEDPRTARFSYLDRITDPDFRELKPMKDAVKETSDSMKILGDIANQTGTLIAQAFMLGRFELDRLFQSLLATIAQMFIMKGLMSALSPASPVLSFIPGIGWNLNKISAPQVVVVGGRISMDSNKFVVSLDRARNSFSANYEVGRGSILNT